MKAFILPILLIIFSCNVQALTAEQQLFKKTYSAALKGDETAVAAGKKQLQGYRLLHYLDYALLKAKITQFPEQEIEQFKKNNPESPLNENLERMLTYEYGKQKQWQKYLSRYKNNKESQTMHCWYLQGRIETKVLKGLEKAIENTWMNGLSLPDDCNQVFKWWEAQGNLTDDLLAERIKLTYLVNNSSTTRYLASKMKTKPKWVNHVIELMQDPMKGLESSLSWNDDENNREIVFHMAKRQAQKQPDSMYRLWKKLKSHFNFSESQITQVERTNALFAATDYLPFTIQAMDALPSSAHDSQINAWKVRYYLFYQDWKNVLKTIEEMPDFQKNKDNWQYWRGRALAKIGDKDQAKSIFTKLSGKTNYYGFLAADHMKLPYEICTEDITPTMIVKMPESLENAFELFELDMIAEARKEWMIGYQKLNNGERRALADLAYQKGWYNKVSAIMAGLGLWKNYKMRYPLAYQHEISQFTKKHKILPHWVMSIITQESAWQTDAISSADARGLMQLIDATAKRLSQKLGLKYQGKSQLHDADFNLQLGIFYQRMLFDRFNNHPLLVLASYNAGESKAEDWLNGFPTSPDIWAETIPYQETRGYITKILTNIVIYDWLIHKTPQRVSSWMPTFPVDGNASKKWPNDFVSDQQVQVRCQQ